MVVHGNILRKQDTDQGSIQPAIDFSHQGYASETQPSRDRIGSPDGRVSPRPSNNPTTPESPKARANIGIRRARQQSVLLKSPARLGHASRMRQIFELASFDDAAPRRDNGVVLYPQLPNISCPGSPVSPVPSTKGSKIHLPAAPEAEVVLQQPPRSPFSSSESWSGDSDYLVKAPPPAPSPPTLFQPINDWLAMVSSDSSFTHDADPNFSACAFSDAEPVLPDQKQLRDLDTFDSGEMASQSPDAISHNWPQMSPQTSNVHLNPHSPLKDIANRHRPTKTSSPQKSYELDDGGVEISPFNPNVCTARGPSRYHNLQSSRSSRQPLRPPGETPCSPIRCKVDRAGHKTPEPVSETREQNAKTSRGLGNARKATRFWRPRGTANVSGGVDLTMKSKAREMIRWGAQ
ncbi:hypothetical protein K505DRAFT_365223 [Melanomma pulvis-pyrius CBS 109.77]|uniref:Uncharacterized protein n=1 Tax=Melanomma pulvis-pyrius CBS 109.77 TaxID=1314802 RepID=A0A6A6X0J3_9PLEO|nr:hypothetical protein K505DRAFT_365223 [Melanomma pulvis-pyrius CBS 109.77]